MEDKNLHEGQYWWAFSCLVLVGRRNAANFHGEMLRRTSGSYPDSTEVNKIVEEACAHLATVFNQGLRIQDRAAPSLGGWERHLIALSAQPVQFDPDADDNFL